MIRARVKALHDKVNSLLCSYGFDAPLDGILPHASVLCILSYNSNDAAQAGAEGSDGFATSRREDGANSVPPVPPVGPTGATGTTNFALIATGLTTGVHRYHTETPPLIFWNRTGCELEITGGTGESYRQTSTGAIAKPPAVPPTRLQKTEKSPAGATGYATGTTSKALSASRIGP